MIYRQFALTIVFSIIVSTFNAISGKPLQSALLLGGGKTNPSGDRWILIASAFGAAYGFLFGGFAWLLLFGGVGALAGANLQRIFHWFNDAFDRLAKAYGRLLERAIHFRRILVSVLLGGVVLTGLAFVAIPSGFVPTEDQGYGLGIIQLPPEASLEATMDVADQARKILAKQPEVVSGEFIGGAGFNGGSVNQGLFFFGLKPIDERTKKNQSAQAIIKSLNQDFQTIKGAKVLAQSPPAVPGFSAQGGLSFQFNDLSNGGYSFTELLQMADELIAKAKEYR